MEELHGYTIKQKGNPAPPFTTKKRDMRIFLAKEGGIR